MTQQGSIEKRALALWAARERFPWSPIVWAAGLPQTMNNWFPAFHMGGPDPFR